MAGVYHKRPISCDAGFKSQLERGGGVNLFLEFFRGDHFGWARVHHLHLHLSPAREGKRETRGYEPLRAAQTHVAGEGVSQT